MDVEKRDVPEHPQNKNLLRILSTIYSLPIASDFRRPVELMYPKIAAAYLSVISTPMDLGTLLLACMRGNATPELIRDGLNLVFTNSMNFNGAAPMMKALSLHLLTYAEGLFEEAVKLPFDISQGVVTEIHFLPILLRKRGIRFETMCKTPLRQDEVKLLEQSLRSIATKGQPFESLMSGIFTKIKEYQVFYANANEHVSDDTPVPILTLESLLRPVVEAAVIPREENASSSSMAVDGDSMHDEMFPAIASLVGLSMYKESRQHIAPALVAKKEYNKKSTAKSGSKKEKAASALLENEAAMDGTEEEVSHDNEIDKEPEISATASSDASSSSSSNGTPPITLNKSFLPFLYAIDGALGELLVQMEERILRGTSSSSVWQRPLMLGWAAAGGIWFPCMVLACPASNSPSESKLVPGAFHGKAQVQALVDINISRIPEIISKQLIRLKSKSCGKGGVYPKGQAPKSSSSSSSSRGMISYEEQSRLLTVPEGFLLIEFYGTHDFGWVKAEAVLPFCVDGTKPSHNRVGSGVDGVRMASSTERWWLLETFQYLPPPHRARLIERLQIDRQPTLVSVANSQVEKSRSKPTSSSPAASSSSSSQGKKKGSSNAKNNTPSQSATEDDVMKSEEMMGAATEEASDQLPLGYRVFKSDVEMFGIHDVSLHKTQGTGASFTWTESAEDVIVPCAIPSLDDLEESTIITNRPYFVPVAMGTNTFSQKLRKDGSNAASGIASGRAGNGKAGHLSAATIARAAAIATALDYSDYSCLIYGGLYSSSLVPIDKRQSKRNIAKDKSFIFSRWAESVSPTPSCDSSRRGFRKRDTLEMSSIMNESDDLDDEAIGGMGTELGGGASSADRKSSSGGGSGFDTASSRKRRKYEPTYAADGMRVRMKPGRKAGWQASAMAEAAAMEFGEASDDDEDTESGDDQATTANANAAAATAVSAVAAGGSASSARNHGPDRSNRESNIRGNTKRQIPSGTGNNTYSSNVVGTTTIQGNFQILVGGCTTFVAGDGCLLSRTVDTAANVFYGEHKKRNQRKHILKQELQRIAGSLALLQSYAAGHPHPPRMAYHPSTLGSGIIGGKTFTQVYSQNRDYHPVKHTAKGGRRTKSKSDEPGEVKIRKKPGPMKGWKLAAAGGIPGGDTGIEPPPKRRYTKSNKGAGTGTIAKPEHKPRRGRIPTVHDPNRPRKGKMTVSMASLELQHFKALKAFADANIDIETSSEHSEHPTGGNRKTVPATNVVKDIVHDGRTAHRHSSRPLAGGLDLAGRGVKDVKPRLPTAVGGGGGKTTSQAAAAAASAGGEETENDGDDDEEDDSDEEGDDEDDDDGGGHEDDAPGTEEDEGADTESDDADGDLNSSEMERDDEEDDGGPMGYDDEEGQQMDVDDDDEDDDDETPVDPTVGVWHDDHDDDDETPVDPDAGVWNDNHDVDDDEEDEEEEEEDDDDDDGDDDDDDNNRR